MSFAIASLLKPFVGLAFFFAVYLIARAMARLIPSGRARDLLYDKTLQKRYPWRFGLGAILGAYGSILLAYWLLS